MNEQSDTFEHLFGGWCKAQARRWINPDGSEGGIVAVEAIVDATAIIHPGAEVFPRACIGREASVGEGAKIAEGARVGYRARVGGARIGNKATVGIGASVGEGDWFHFAGPFGENRQVVTAVHSEESGLRWWVGCRDGITTDEFVKALGETHARGGEYAHLIAFVTTHPEVIRREAERKRKAQAEA